MSDLRLCAGKFRLPYTGTERIGAYQALELSGTIVPSRLVRVRGEPARVRRLTAGHGGWER